MTPRAAHPSENETLEAGRGTTRPPANDMDGEANDPPESLEAQLEASSRGDERAFGHFYDTVAPRIHGMVIGVLRDVHQSEEVTQEVFLEIWRTSSRFDHNRGSALAWAMTMAHRKAVDRVRSSEAWRRRDAADAERNRPALTDETASAAQASLNARGLRTALRSLSACQRQAIELAYFGGYTHSEVSELLQVPLGTAKTRIRDGLIRLRDTLSA